MSEDKLERITNYYLKENNLDWNLFLVLAKDNEVNVILDNIGLNTEEDMRMFTVDKNIKDVSLIDIRQGLNKLVS
ncbi:hypothetical protein PZL33_10635 [Staphylococcus hominis]|uniref:Uncharacterized protein n=2 Tax=Staphylococcus TaxID=1279 RepID=A0A8X8KJA3_STAHO|nr:hypothetical protein [Staphylococcus hominis]ADA61627.1 hypothetical protein SAP020A_052 [Staphylococcus sp. CDC3]MCM5673000.1 hypothetical protein [Staphylococcus hominis]MDH9922352.1 hypothetical protein [Staphylococcus hominis]MDH9924639.1 hypothetical protein [Staphylococcus hominis]